MPLLGDLNDRPNGKDETEEALGDLKVGKAPGLEGVAPELLRGRCRKNRHFLKELILRSRTYELRGQGKRRNVQNQDKQTPHTVLQKLSPKPSRTPLSETLN